MSKQIVLLLLGLGCGVTAEWYMKLMGEPVCFVEEVGYGLDVIEMKYRMRDREHGENHHANTEGIGSMAEANAVRPFVVTVVNAAGTQILQRDVGDFFGTITWKVTEDVTGAYEICVAARPDAQATQQHPLTLSFHIDHSQKRVHKPAPRRETVKGTGPSGLAVETFIEQGGQVKEILKSVEELERVHDELQDLQDRIKEIKREGGYFYERQKRFNLTTTSTYERVYWFSFATIAVVVLCSTYQYFHLKAFLIKKKLV
eukprot:TRINITY_DN10262_c0_g1_i1.p1 TRINITY_DN10262_c0_g1~~TRINITY_DN10262_c0_g1_i1.p1  ORF type:complete len:258 (+),score=43.68 TRINITY_DN10262_c0_g1_i1:62-835(+)